MSYEFKGNPIINPEEIPRIGNLVYDERGEEVLRLHNERFKDVNYIENTHNYKKGEPISYPNVPRVLSYNQIIRERFPDMCVLSPENVVNCWDAIPDKEETYADTSGVAAYPNEGPNEDLRKRVLEIVGKPKIKIPLMVCELGVEKADNAYGFDFVETDYMDVSEALFLGQDGNVSYGVEDGIVSSEEGIPVWTPSSQSGLRGLCRGGSDVLGAGVDSLLGSDGSGRVQILYDPKGRRENLEVKLAQIQEGRNKLVAEIDSRLPGALDYLRTGKIL